LGLFYFDLHVKTTLVVRRGRKTTGLGVIEQDSRVAMRVHDNPAFLFIQSGVYQVFKKYYSLGDKGEERFVLRFLYAQAIGKEVEHGIHYAIRRRLYPLRKAH